MAAKVVRGSHTSVTLSGTSNLESTNLWEIHNQLEQVVGSDTAPHGWECMSADGGVTAVVTAPAFALTMPHTVYWRTSADQPFRFGPFTVA
jgi:hypothetical protein